MRIDWITLSFEVVNFLVLLWLLERFVFRRLAAALRARRDAIAEAGAAAERERVEVARVREEVEREREGLRALRDAVRQETLADAFAERARLLEQARSDAEDERARSRRLIESERQATAASVEALAVERATDLAGRLLLALAPEAVDDALLDRLIERVADGAAVHGAGRGAAGPIEAELAAARVPSERAIAALRSALERAHGVPVRLSVREEPDLLGGARLRIGDVVFDASVEGQLVGLRALAATLVDAPGEAPPGEPPRPGPARQAADEARHG